MNINTILACDHLEFYIKNRSETVRVENNDLMIKVNVENDDDKNLTLERIYLKNRFTFGRFEIRAK